MKKSLVVIGVIGVVLVLCGCQTSTRYGKCVGTADIPDPKYVYDLNLWNCFLGALFSERTRRAVPCTECRVQRNLSVRSSRSSR